MGLINIFNNIRNYQNFKKKQINFQRMFPVFVPDLRQADSTNDRYNSNSNNNYQYKYQSLSNSSMSNSEGSLNLCEAPNDHLKTECKLVKSTSDQKLPESAASVPIVIPQSFVYVNKNGQAIKTKVPLPINPGKRCDENSNSRLASNSGEMLCNSFLVELAKSTDNNGYAQLKNYEPRKSSNGRSVPTINVNGELNRSETSHDNSLITPQNNGEYRINTSLAIQEPNIEITYEHVKYINIFSMLCCWCFPFTGILSIIFARMTKKYYKMRDLTKAKRYLNRSEWMLIATLFFGLSIIAILFAYIQHTYFTDLNIRANRFLPVSGSSGRHMISPAK